VDVEPRQLYCKYLCVFFFDFDNKKKYFLREGESSIEYTELKKLLPKVQENANRFYNFFSSADNAANPFSMSLTVEQYRLVRRAPKKWLGLSFQL